MAAVGRLITAMVTPFDEEGHVDYLAQTLEELNSEPLQ